MLNVFISKFAVLVICFSCFCSGQHDNNKGITDLAEENNGQRLFIVTLDGTLVNAEQKTGQLHWKIKDHPIVQAASNNSNAISPIFLPDPIDGSLYLAGGDRKFKKLPFTIPQLVANSPCRSSDGILYTGKKTDTWYKLDPQSGNRQQVLGWDEANPICPVEMNKFVYIGKTKYDIMMVDSMKSKLRWNITFYDYTAAMMTEEDKTKYGFIHLASTSSGHLVTIDKKNGKLLWDLDLGSPVVAIYLLDNDDSLISVPFTGVSNKTMYYLRNEILSKDIPLSSDKKINLYSSLYVGEHQHGLYVTPSLVDEDTVILPVEHIGQLQIEGPQISDQSKLSSNPIPGHNYILSKDLSNNDVDTNFQILPEFNHKNIYTGHYNLPQYNSPKVMGGTGGKLLLTDKSQNNIKKPENNNDIIQTLYPNNIIKTQNPEPNGEKVRSNFQSIYSDLKGWINQQENKGLKLSLIIMTGCVIAMFWHLQTQVRLIQNASQGSKSNMNSQSEHPEELADGMVKIGKIAFDPTVLLGKGCEGTFVYRGLFDNRKVAVKRLLPECFTFADREVALLRESDTHPNVIRYYCMEQDRMFRYIALELCQATLSDYIQGKCKIPSIEPIDILQQATSGLAHLHSLDIVHRDIKPHNVLLSLPDNKGKVKVMISDFGLCKKLQVGRISFSRRSGITGTDGWIAPEMINGSGRTTAAVDMFSLGCLFYYVLSRGSHPFGDVLSRQSNILLGVYNLTELKGQDWQKCIQLSMLLALLSPNPERRPPAATVLKHPMFWNLEKISSFFQDVSDRVERAEPESTILQTLESGSKTVVKFDWREHLSEELVSDLRKYRSYKGDSVRDLLRALRNKKHHFYELSITAQKQLEENPNKLTEYWIITFPLLLAYVWTTMQCLSKENTFQDYFDASFVFSNSSLQHHIATNPSLRLREPSNISPDSKCFSSTSCLDHEAHSKFTKVRKKQPNARNPKLNKKSILNVIESDNAKELNVNDSCGDTKLTKNKGPMELKKRKRKKKVEEPLFWSVES